MLSGNSTKYDVTTLLGVWVGRGSNPHSELSAVFRPTRTPRGVFFWRVGKCFKMDCREGVACVFERQEVAHCLRNGRHLAHDTARGQENALYLSQSIYSRQGALALGRSSGEPKRGDDCRNPSSDSACQLGPTIWGRTSTHTATRWGKRRRYA